MSMFFKDMFAPNGQDASGRTSSRTLPKRSEPASGEDSSSSSQGVDYSSGSSSERTTVSRMSSLMGMLSRSSQMSLAKEEETDEKVLQDMRALVFADDQEAKAAVSNMMSFAANHYSLKKRKGSSSLAVNQHHGSMDGDFGELHAGFYEEVFDPLKYVLDGYPDKRGEQEAYLMEQLNRYKKHMKDINAEVLNVVQDHHESLVHGMKQVQGIDLELTRATINIKNARRRLNLVNQGLIKGDLNVTQKYRRRERAKQAISNLSRVFELVKRRKQVFDIADREQNVPRAVKVCVDTIKELDADPINAKFHALMELRHNMVTALPALRQRTDDTLQKICGQKYTFDAESYAEVVRSYVALDQSLEVYGTATKARVDGVNGLPQRVQRLFISMVEKALKEQMVSHLQDLESARKPTTPTSKKMDDPRLSSERAKEIGLSEICEQLPSRTETVSPSFVRRLSFAYETICELLYNYDRITTWHNDFGKHCFKELQVEGYPEDMCSTLEQKFLSIAQSLESGKLAVWGGVLAHISTVAKSPCARFPGLKLHSFDNLVKVTDILTIVSHAFGGETCVLELRAFIRELCKSYCRAFHQDRLEVLRSFLRREHWHMINVPLESLGGINGLIHRGVSKHILRSKSMHEDDDPIQDSHEQSKYKPAQSMDQLTGKLNPFQGLLLAEEDVEKKKTVKSLGENEDDEQEEEEEQMEKMHQEETIPQLVTVKSTQVVLTTTVINGLARDVGSYLLVMERIPSIASDTFLKLRSLYNFYFYSIMTNFVPAGLLYEVFDKPNSGHGERYWKLRERMMVVREELRGDILHVRVPTMDSRTVHGQSQNQNGSSLAMKLTRKDSRRATTGSANFESAYKTIPTRIPRKVIDLITGEIPTRIVAAESIDFAKHILESVRSRAEPLLPSVERAQMSNDVYEEIAQVSAQLRDLLHRATARDLINQFNSDVLSNRIETTQGNIPPLVRPSSGDVKHFIIETVQWHRIRTLQAEPSQYVQKVQLRMRKIWSHLQRESMEGSAYPLGATTMIWSHCVGELFDQVLDGFASIGECTTEGRAQMSLDLAMLCKNLQDIAPFDESMQNGKQKVDLYIKAFYYDREKDVLEWIQQNLQSYELWHLHNLVLNGIGNKKPTQIQTRLKSQVDAIYNARKLLKQ